MAVDYEEGRRLLAAWTKTREDGSPWAWRSIEGTAHHTDCFTHFRPIEPPGADK